MGEGCSSEAQPGEDGWQGGDYCGGDVVVVGGVGGGGVVVGSGGCNSSDIVLQSKDLEKWWKSQGEKQKASTKTCDIMTPLGRPVVPEV